MTMHGINLPASKHKGWLLSGFPKTVSQLEKFVQINMNPHLVIVLNENKIDLINQLKENKKIENRSIEQM